jgi:hypothetical protein
VQVVLCESEERSSSEKNRKMFTNTEEIVMDLEINPMVRNIVIILELVMVTLSNETSEDYQKIRKW